MTDSRHADDSPRTQGSTIRKTRPTDEALAELIDRIGRRDRLAFAEFYNRTCRLVHSIALRICDQPGTAEELVQDVYLGLWNRTSSFDTTRGHPLAWLATVARHKAIDNFRRSQTDVRVALRAGHQDEDPYEGLPGDEPDPMDNCIAKSDDREVVRCLALLSPAQRQCVALAFYGGYSSSEIALALNRPLGTVKSHIRRALDVLRHSFGKQP